MFTGLIEAAGAVRLIRDGRLELEADLDGIAVGESIAVNGCCLTVVGDRPLVFDLSEETMRRTALGALKPGDIVNLERAMSAGGRFGGHIVQGHVDATGSVMSLENEGKFARLTVEGPEAYGRYLIDKGSVAVDGISLTVVDPRAGAFDVYLIPHTIAQTNLRIRKAGDLVNLEYDVIAKYVERLVHPAA